jgi:SsrA-binding protein
MAKKPAAPAKKTEEKDKEKVRYKTVAENRRARHEYEVIDVFQAGIVLAGTEVKSMRQGRANLADSFARVEDGEMWLYNCHISPYDHGNRFNHEPARKRKLLMHDKEISKLKSRMQEKGLTIVPLKLYFLGNWAKIDVALARGKQLWDKREDTAKRDAKRQIERVVKERR